MVIVNKHIIAYCILGIIVVLHFTTCTKGFYQLAFLGEYRLPRLESLTRENVYLLHSFTHCAGVLHRSCTSGAPTYTCV